MQQIDLGNIIVDVIHKDIKNIHLSVYPPAGRVKIAAPFRMDLETIRLFAISKLGWIRRQQEKFLNQEREAPREYLTKESHYFLGKRYLMKIIVVESSTPKVFINHDKLILQVRYKSNIDQKHTILQEWYRRQLKEIVPKYITKWEEIMNVKVLDFGIKKMRTKWGTCNREAKRIWINLELAKKPPECLEYIVVHEMVHLLERNHNERFIAYLDKFLPQWRHYKEELNRLPISHTEWGY